MATTTESISPISVGTPRGGRAVTFERTVTAIVGTIAVLLGAMALVVGTGVFGVHRARRGVLDPLVLSWIRDNPGYALGIGVGIGVVLAVFGVWWIVRAARPEPRPNPNLRTGDEGATTVAGTALAEAVRADAREISGVTRVRINTTGRGAAPGLRLVLFLQHGTDVRQVWDELDEKVLARARQALQTEVLPTAVRLELDRAPRQRVR